MSWKNPSIAPAPRSGPPKKRRRKLDPVEIRTPRIFFENALEQPRFHDAPWVEIDDSGTITSWSIVSGKFSSPMDLRRFLFDRQMLAVRIGSFEDASTSRSPRSPT